MFKSKMAKPKTHRAPEIIDGLVYEDAATNEKFLVKGSKRYRFVSDRAYESWGISAIRVASVDILGNTEYGGILGFRDSTLLENIADGRLYLISGNRLRHITNPDWLWEYGLLEDIVQVSAAEIEIHKEGEPLN